MSPMTPIVLVHLLFAPPPARGDSAPKEDLRAAKAMHMVIANADFKAMPLEEFAEWLERTTQVNVVVKWKTLGKVGIKKSSPITLKCKDIPVWLLLPQVFDKLTKGKKDVHLACKADENLLIISTEEDLVQLETHSYDVEELLIAVPNFPAATNDGDPTGRKRPMNLRQNSQAQDDAKQPKDERVRKLIEIITSQIKPKSWKVNGGKGTITFFKGKLIVRNTPEVHAMLGGATGKQPIRLPK